MAVIHFSVHWFLGLRGPTYLHAPRQNHTIWHSISRDSLRTNLSERQYHAAGYIQVNKSASANPPRLRTVVGSEFPSDLSACLVNPVMKRWEQRPRTRSYPSISTKPAGISSSAGPSHERRTAMFICMHNAKQQKNWDRRSPSSRGYPGSITTAKIYTLSYPWLVAWLPVQRGLYLAVSARRSSHIMCLHPSLGYQRSESRDAT